jgi:pimeloyl-ACP methyl ester carboxylesterase
METLVKVYFSPDMDIAEANAYLPLLQTESRQAVLEMLAPVFRTASARSDLPVLVMGGAEDAVFPPALLRFTATPWRAPVEIIPGAGHMLMLDPQWEDAAQRILRWLRESHAPGSK